MGYHRNFQYAIREFRIEWRNSESWSPWKNRANNLIIIIKEEWKQRTVRRRIPKNFWSFGLAWEAEIYSHTLYKGGTTGMERITVDTIYKSEWTEFCYYELFQYWENQYLEENLRIGRWIGVSHRVGSALWYWILTAKGKVIARKTV